ncbi:hypothetical protein PF004_g9651 [Phytophthora fragariae]|uniref:Uncharacterized protein n=2 Tax=Phytophthora fragariae TaxID=53985 RepID=A0A6G0P368_9STRA|nr:hypothetical protein PF004_g9651 [Phytophthora fragariae]
METTTPVQHPRHLEGSTTVLLRDPENELKVDWADYVLQDATGANTAAPDMEELSGKIATVCGLCAKRWKRLSAKIVQELFVPFAPTELVPVINPGTLCVVIVSRQHVLDCALKRNIKTGVSMLAPPPDIPAIKVCMRKAAASSAGGRPATPRKLTSYLSDEECDIYERETIFAPIVMGLLSPIL